MRVAQLSYPKLGFWSKLLSGRSSLSKLPVHKRQRKYSANPVQPTIYAIGDVHGRIDLLTKLHNSIDRDWAERDARGSMALEIYLGDLIDRGPGSANVVAELLKRKATRNCVFILGNHEVEFLHVLAGTAKPEQIMQWLRMGGAATAQSYGVKDIPRRIEQGTARFVATLKEGVPESHRQFLENSQLLYVAEPYLFVHAGIRPGLGLAQQSSVDLFSIREEFLLSDDKHDYVVVHGHTPVMDVQFLSNRINVDTGAFATNRLSCVRLDNDGTASLLID
jgi:serine/threonine protein phosphatase 1